MDASRIPIAVAREMLNSRATAETEIPDANSARIFFRWASFVFGGLPMCVPGARARAWPARVRSMISSRSKSATAASTEVRKVHQLNVFTVNTPMRHGLARFMTAPSQHLELAAFYQHKRDLFRAGLAQTRLRALPGLGSYFRCVAYSAVSDLEEKAFCRWLTTEVGVAAIPQSAF